MLSRELKYNQNFMTRVAKAREWVMDLIKHGLVTNRLNAKTIF